MKRLSKIFVITLVVVVLAACASVDDVMTREVVVDEGEETETAVPSTNISPTPTSTATLTPIIPAPTLGEQLKKYELPTNTLPDEVLEQRASAAYLNTEHTFLISYFAESTSTQSTYSIRFLKFDKATNVWSSTEVFELERSEREDCPFNECYFRPGAVMHILESEDFYFVRTHLNPSAGFTFVLTSDLELHDVLFGSIRQLFADGTAVYSESNIHFAPTHFTLLDIYDPATREIYSIFPHEPHQELWLAREEKMAQIYDELGKTWCQENNHHCNPALFNNYLASDIVVNDDTDSLAFIITFSGELSLNAIEETKAIYIYRNVHDNSLLEYRETSENELLGLVGTTDLKTLLEKETLDLIFTYVKFIVEPTFPAVYLPAWMPNLEPTPTPLSLSNLIWANDIQLTTSVDSYSFMWSPTDNAFVFDHCPRSYPTTVFIDLTLFTAQAPDFKPANISPTSFICSRTSKFIWRPDGEVILFNALPIQSEFVESSYLWTSSLHLMDSNGSNLKEIDIRVGEPDIKGWMDNNTVVYIDYGGGTPRTVSMLDVESGNIAAWNRIYVGDVYDLTQDYVVGNNGARIDTWYSAEVFSRQAVREEKWTDLSPYSQSLSIDYDVSPYELFFNSQYETTLPNTNQILVLTWNADVVIDRNILTGSIDTDLQLWNLDTNELDLIIPGGIYGRYSPNGHYLVYLTPETNSSQLHLLDQTTGKILFTQTAFAEADLYSAEVKAYTTFSPNGRYLTFFNPAHELTIYDLENGEFLAPVTAVPTTPLWSPDGSRFVYQDPAAGLSIFETRSATAYPLATSGSDRLRDPQWSFDGTYLSVMVLQENWWERETAVLQIP